MVLAIYQFSVQVLRYLYPASKFVFGKIRSVPAGESIIFPQYFLITTLFSFAGPMSCRSFRVIGSALRFTKYRHNQVSHGSSISWSIG